MVTNILLLLIILILLIFLSMIWPPDSPWAPWWRTSDKAIRRAFKLAKLKSSDIVYDLGSGDGRVLIIAAKEFGAKGVGIEIDPLRFFISTIMIRINRVQDRVAVQRKDFFDVNISDATVVFLYLVPKALERLRSKLLKELKPGTKVISLKYEIDLPIVSKDVKNNIYLYKIL